MKETRRHGLTFSVVSMILTTEKLLAESADLGPACTGREDSRYRAT